MFIEVKRSYIRQCRSGSKIHRESLSNRWLQIRPTTIRVRTILSPFDDIFVQGRIGTFRYRKIFTRAFERSFPTSH